VVNEGVTCDGCSAANFAGVRHKCSKCFDYDLCDDCFLNGVSTKTHDPSHPMQTIVPRSTNDAPSISDYADLYIGEDFEAASGDAADASSAASRTRSARSPPSSSTSQPKVFKCPFCGDEGFLEQEFCMHVLTVHAGDSTPVVCPVCATRPGGDPMYVSRNFHGHIEIRHLHTEERAKRLLSRAPKSGLFATSHATSALLNTLTSPSSATSSRLLSELVKQQQKNPPAKIPRLSNLPPIPVKLAPPAISLLPSLEPARTDQELAEANNKKILKSIFLRELLYSTLVAKQT